MRNISLRNFRQLTPTERRNNFIGHLRKEDGSIDLYEFGDEEIWTKVIQSLNSKSDFEKEVDKEIEELETKSESSDSEPSENSSLLSEPLFLREEPAVVADLISNPDKVLNLEEISEVLRYILLEN